MRFLSTHKKGFPMHTTTTLLARATVVLALTSAAFTVGAQTAPATPDKAATEAAFMRADGNKDGMLSKDEAAKLPAISAKFTQLDANKDGQLSAEEFMVGYTAPN
jgi:EF hand